jgi:glucose/arabinose dehydrogenase
VDLQSIHEEVIMNRDSRNKGNTMSRVVALVLFSMILFFVENRIEAGSLPLDTIKLPPGFVITVYADNVPNARGMTLGQHGTLFVGSRDKGDVYAVIDKDGDQRADGVFTIASGLNMPVGVAYRNGSLFVSAVDRILRFDKVEQRLTNPPTPVTITDGFPNEAHHGWKFIAFGPDGKLYVPVGAPCNICEPDPDRYALIARVNPDGSGYEIVARGVRNTVGFDWDPTTHDLWFTDNGRDNLGDNQPPDELNHAPKAGLHFGYPYCHGGTIPDPEYGSKHACREFTAPAVTLGPHVASLGMRFYTGTCSP